LLTIYDSTAIRLNRSLCCLLLFPLFMLDKSLCLYVMLYVCICLFYVYICLFYAGDFDCIVILATFLDTMVLGRERRMHHLYTRTILRPSLDYPCISTDTSTSNFQSAILRFDSSITSIASEPETPLIPPLSSIACSQASLLMFWAFC
jgi:hypothetical protein